MKYISSLCFFILFVLSGVFTIAATNGSVVAPALTGPVVDQVGLISQRAQRSLSESLWQVREKGGPQIQVLVISSLQDQSIEQVAISIFDQWKLGEVKKNNGLLFLIAPHEKKLRLEVGRGLEGVIPDAIAKRIIADAVAPYFKRGDFDMGVAQGVTAILHYAGSDAAEVEAKSQDKAQTNADSLLGDLDLSKIIFFIIIVFWIGLFIFNPTLALALLFSGRGGGRGGGGWSGGSGGGGWSGGGGNSAGGGASGDW